MKKKILALLIAFQIGMIAISGCTNTPAQSAATTAIAASSTTAAVKGASKEGAVDNQNTNNADASTTPKYIFLFLGDGMSYAQINAAQVYLGNNNKGEVATKNLNFTQFPVAGTVTTYDATSFCPDSASTATSISSGIKTQSGVIGLSADLSEKPTTIAESLKAQGKKIGIISSVTINHATPAAFYAHVESRNEYYTIAQQMADSGFDYFAGGSIYQPTGQDKDQTSAYDILKNAGYTKVSTASELEAIPVGTEKIYAESPVLQDSGAMPYSIDLAEEDATLKDYVENGIRLLDNDEGFFMVCEGGKIDWACHANDAKTAISEVVAFADAVQSAIDFAEDHPGEVLVLVTGDHETGGLSLGYAATGYNTAFQILEKQKLSYVAFDEMFSALKEQKPELTFEEVLPIIKDNFGLIPASAPEAQEEANKLWVLTDSELTKLQTAFTESMLPEDQRTESDATALLYGSYDPLSVTITHIVNNKAGIGWSSYSHTGTPVAVYAMGAGAELFGGSYDNTEIYSKMAQLTGIA